MDSHVLVTTDRSVAVVQYDAASHEYALQELALESIADAHAEVIASGVIEYPGKEAIAVAYADDEKLFLHVVAVDELLRVSKSTPAATSSSTSTKLSVAPTAAGLSSSIRFELVSAPTTIASVKALSTHGASEVFHGVILFRAESMAAFGFTEAKTGDSDAVLDANSSPQCTRLSSEQFANFFPEFAAFSHPVLAVDTLVQSPSGDEGVAQSWIAFGCADGFVRVFSGHVQDNCSCGPYQTKDFQIDGPVTSVSLFATVKESSEKHSSQRQCNLLATCAVGHAIVYEDVFGTRYTTELLEGSDHFDSIFSGIAADIDLDGRVELLLGTDDQHLIAYKRCTQPTPQQSPSTSPSALDELTNIAAVDTEPSNEHIDKQSLVLSEPTNGTEDTSVTPDATLTPADLTEQHATEPEAADKQEDEEELTKAISNWSQLSRAQWHVEAFGAIYSIARLDLNRDGVDELLVASATGVFVYEADARYVLQKLEQLLQLSSLAASSQQQY